MTDSRGILKAMNTCRLAAALLLVAASCQSAPPAAPDARASVEVWLTTADGASLMTRQPDIEISAAAGADIVVDPSTKYQEMIGFGAAITDASAYLIQTKLDEQARATLIGELFGPPPGANFSFTRVPIGASDFSHTHYSFNDMPAGQKDPALASFSIASARAQLLPTLKAAQAANPQLTIMASPWSPPAWMKTTHSLIKGALREEAYGSFALYLRRSIEAFADEGVAIDFISLQNEPDFEPADYPGMRLSPGQRADLIANHVGPELRKAGLNTKILEWDHNWDQPEQPLAVLADADAAAYVSGVAWHCYAGDVAAQGKVRAVHPDKDVFFTECSGGGWAREWPDSFLWTMKNIVIGTTENWSRGAIMWNLALDENSGPHLGGCGDCRGVVTIDGRTGAITRNSEYYALSHASRFVRRGAFRIEGDCSGKGLSCVAFLNPDGSRALVVLNEADKPVPFTAGEAGRAFRYEMPAMSAATFVWAGRL